MILSRNISESAKTVSVQCCACLKMVRLSDALFDLNGTPFHAYYHEACAPVTSLDKSPLDKPGALH